MRRHLPLLLLLAAAPAAAQAAPDTTRPAGPAKIQDNSFLIEEAYNQEPGVVQHISTFQRDVEGRGWAYGFTQEWPFLSQRHQLSYTVPVLRTGGGTGLGDVALNYRLQLVGSGETPVAFSPRLSVLLPTGDEDAGRGAGTVGVQGNLPLSVELGDAWVAHTNAGATFTPGRDGADDVVDLSAGQSLIWLARPRFNLMLEAVWNRGDAGGEDADDFYLSPGVRGAFDFASGLQVVPGVAVPVRVGPGESDWSVLLYLSLEHPFRRGRS